MTARKLEPDNLDYLYALAEYHFQRGNLRSAKDSTARMVTAYPNNPLGLQMQRFIEDRMKDNP
jgi:hypothetical protein